MINYVCKYYKLFIGCSLIPLVLLATQLRSIEGPNWIGFNLPLVIMMILIGGLDFAIYRRAKALDM